MLHYFLMLKSLSSSTRQGLLLYHQKAEYSEAWRGSKTGLRTHSWDVEEQKGEPGGPIPEPPLLNITSF